MIKWVIRILIGLIVLFGLVGAGVVGYVYWNLQPVSKNKVVMEVTVPSGANAKTVSDLLYKVGLIRNSQIAAWYFIYRKVDRQLQAGTYTLSTDLGVEGLAQKLLSNPAGVRVTLLEGWRREQVAEMLEKSFADQGTNFTKKEFLTLTKGLEGKLFPDTYVFSPSSNAETVVKILIENFDKKTKEIGIEESSVDGVVRLASLVEREAKTPSDKKLVAGVLMNRLNSNIPLQVDATLQYAKANRICGMTATCNDWWPAPRSEDKELNSEFNTYTIAGLPLQAIANPGTTALEAAWNPQPSEYIYYLTDNEGVTHFAKIYEEHLENINKYLR